MKDINKKILKTKLALRIALCNLIKKDINELTVSEVCREANINRTTFYKYYSLPIDILNEYIAEMNKKALEQIKRTGETASSDDYYQLILALCRSYYENKQMIRVYIEFNKDYLSIMQKFIKENTRYGIKDDNLTYFIAGGVSSMIIQWVLNDFDKIPEEIAGEMTKYILILRSGSRIC